MKPILIGFLFVFAILSLPLVLNKELLPSLLSYQDPIDPTTLFGYESNEKIGYFNNKSIAVPQLPAPNNNKILGETVSASAKRIEVNLSNQHTYAYEGDHLVFDFVISSGKWDRTHPGDYTIWSKVPKQKMSGGSIELGTYYYLPNVPHIMFFYNETHPKQMGYSFHGAYWHNNFGIPMSHGCVNMKISDSEKII